MLCVSFFELLLQHHESGLLGAFCITADFTFDLELMGYCGDWLANGDIVVGRSSSYAANLNVVHSTIELSKL